MKTHLRFFALLLALVLTVPAAVACANTADPEGTDEVQGATTTAPADTAEDTSHLYDADGYLKSDLPELDFGKETVTVLYWSDVEMQEYEAEELNSVLVNDAIYKRNANVQEKLNIEFEWLSTPGNGSNINPFVNYVGNIYQGGDTPLDLISAYSRTTATCAYNGYCADMADLPYLNFTMPWWPESLLDVVSIGDSVYFASGDASINMLHLMYALYFNKDLIASLQLENPVDLVRSHEWTLDTLIEMTKEVYLDGDSDGSKSPDDRYGFVGADFGFDAFYTGSGLRLVEQDEEKLLIVSEDFYSDKAITLCSKLGEWNATLDCNVGSEKTAQNAFVTGNALFIQDRCHLADKQLVGNVDFSYGIVPTPLYDKDQENYISVVGNPFSLYGIFVSSADLERSAAVLECWAAEAYRTTTPAQFEMNMKLRYSETSDESEMYNIIRTTVCFDLGRLFNNMLNKITDMYYQAAAQNQNWSSVSSSSRKLMDKYMGKVADEFEKLR